MEARPHEEFGGQDAKLLGALGARFLSLIRLPLSGYLLYSSFLVGQPSLLLSPHGGCKGYPPRHTEHPHPLSPSP